MNLEYLNREKFPKSIRPCRLCHTVCVYIEADDHETPGHVRIGASCDAPKGFESRDFRTEYFPLAEAVEEYNKLYSQTSTVNLGDL